jgi:hypothetical protein
METTVSGLFASEAAAQKARLALQSAGFPAEHMVMITNETDHRHELLGEETSDAVRGSRLGAMVAAVGMGLGGAAMSLPPVSLFQVHWAIAALVGAVGGACAGAVIGLLVGSATGHQVQEQYEHGIELGGVVLAVNTDGAHADTAHEVMVRAGGTSLSTSVHVKHHEMHQVSA